MEETDVLRMFLARAENYDARRVQHIRGRLYSVVLGEEEYTAVVLLRSFLYYELRYHIALKKPTLVICHIHDSVLPIPVLSTRAGNFAKPYELPEEIEDIERQRGSKIGCQVLLGMYISGLRKAQTMVKEFPPTTRKRYLQRAKALGKRKRGKPVGPLSSKPSEQPK